MRYKIIITSPSKETIDKVHALIRPSEIYNSVEDIINLELPKEVCDECAKRS